MTQLTLKKDVIVKSDMFRKKLSSIEIFPKFLCSCCWSNKPHRDGKNLDRKDSDVVSTAQTHRSSGDGASLNQTGIKCHCFFKATFTLPSIFFNPLPDDKF